MRPTLRPAGFDDLDQLAVCQTACWRETFSAVVPAEHLEDPRYERVRRQEWAARLAAGITVWLAELDGEIVGFSCGGPSRDAEPATPLELYTLYLRAFVHGAGLADRLMDAAIGDAAASLWVWEGNARARAYYARHGFTLDGVAKPDGPTRAPMLRLVRPGLSR
ncbi:MAG TPA: GNAT family N-acetyltransferase [Sporichthyaceae bacterium]|nr:GNAT family N-acetyltransferase [Sporichthyaceae bacterium]